MKNPAKIGDVFKVTAVFDSNASEPHYKHFNIHPITANLFGNKVEDIVTIFLKISEDQEIRKYINGDKADYWGWLDFKEKRLSMIYPQRFLLDMCFPHGIKTAEEHGKYGKAYRLEYVPEST